VCTRRRSTHELHELMEEGAIQLTGDKLEHLRNRCDQHPKLRTRLDESEASAHLIVVFLPRPRVHRHTRQLPPGHLSTNAPFFRSASNKLEDR
jgi:hypothetical protein